MVASAGISLAALCGRFLMGWPPEPLILPEELRNCINKRRCVAFIGSGVSSRQCPSWPKLVNALCENCGSSQRVGEEGLADDLLSAAEDAKSCDEEAYHRHIAEQFGAPVTDVPVLYGVLLRLPFSSYLTTNFDRLLVKAAELNPSHGNRRVWAYPNLDRRHVNSGSIHCLHGIVQESETPNSNTIVLTASEFEAAYEDNSPLMNFLIPTLENDAICFIGCRLQEPSMKTVLEICQRHQRRRIESQLKPPPPKFILIPRPVVSTKDEQGDHQLSRERLTEQQRYYNALGITTVWYTPTDSSHSILQGAFEELAAIPSLTPEDVWEGEH